MVHHAAELFPDRADLLLHTPLLSFFGHYGYSIGKFSEFFIDNMLSPCEFSFGSVEVTFGNATPLAVHLFNAHQDKHVHGPWSDINTVRIHGNLPQHAELLLLNSLRRYAERFDLQPRVFEIAPVNWATEEDYADIQNRTDPDPTSIPGDIEPLRCFYFR
ncbi:hypothetical protein LP414_30970 [Polaromonas sp. P1(28)-13]|nr:hypothetical protein LP414_30970 [Polaromonas sp. P1(28)-13]